MFVSTQTEQRHSFAFPRPGEGRVHGNVTFPCPCVQVTTVHAQKTTRPFLEQQVLLEPCLFLRHWPGITKNSPRSQYRSRKWWPVPEGERATFLTVTGDHVSEWAVARWLKCLTSRVPGLLSYWSGPLFPCGSALPSALHFFWLRITFKPTVSVSAGSLTSKKKSA